MKLRRQHVEGIAQAIARALNNMPGATMKAPPSHITTRIAALLEANMAAERAIEDEAHRLLTQQVRKTAMQIDESRAFQLIKKELAKKKGFVL